MMSEFEQGRRKHKKLKKKMDCDLNDDNDDTQCVTCGGDLLKSKPTEDIWNGHLDEIKYFELMLTV